MKISYALITILFLAGQEFAQAAWPIVQAPPQSNKEKVAENVRVNGLAMQISHFKSYLSAREVLNFYRNKWSAKFDESTHGQWQQISRMQKNYFITVQVQEAGFSNSFGRINILNLSEKPAAIGVNTPMIFDSEILNEVVTKDKSNISIVTLIANKYSVDANTQYYESYYKQKGWNVVLAQTEQQENQMLVFRKQNTEITITLNPFNSGSSIVMNYVEKRRWFN